MTLPVFIVSSEALQSDVIELYGDEGRHAAVVTRIRTDEQIMLTDGRGDGARCVVRSVGKSGLLCDVLERRHEPVVHPRLIVVQAIPKGDHAERAGERDLAAVGDELRRDAQRDRRDEVRQRPVSATAPRSRLS